MVQPFGQIGVEPGGQDGPGGAGVVVRQAVQPEPPVGGVADHEGQARIPVPGLAHGPGVDMPVTAVPSVGVVFKLLIGQALPVSQSATQAVLPSGVIAMP